MNTTITERPVTLELSYDEARRLMAIVGSIGSPDLRSIIKDDEEYFERAFGTTSPAYIDAPRRFLTDLYYSLSNAGVAV